MHHIQFDQVRDSYQQKTS